MMLTKTTNYMDLWIWDTMGSQLIWIRIINFAALWFQKDFSKRSISFNRQIQAEVQVKFYDLLKKTELYGINLKKIIFEIGSIKILMRLQNDFCPIVWEEKRLKKRDEIIRSDLLNTFFMRFVVTYNGSVHGSNINFCNKKCCCYN